MSHDALLDAVAESPNDDGPRQVFADWLLQQTDEVMRARGEYISLACSTARSTQRTSRMEELYDRHEEAWIGPIAGITSPERRVWSRGFLDACGLERGNPGAVERALGSPVWRTLRLLETLGSELPSEDLVRLICQPALSGLRSLSTHQACIAPIAESAHMPRVKELAVAPSSGTSPVELFRLLRADCFANLRRLHVFGCSPQHAGLVMRSGLTLVTVTSPRLLDRWIVELDERSATFAEVRLVSSGFPLLARHGIELILRPEDGRWSTLEIRWTNVRTEAGDDDKPKLRDEVIRTLEQLPPGRLTRATLVGPASARFDVARWRTRVITALRSQVGITIDRAP